MLRESLQFEFGPAFIPALPVVNKAVAAENNSRHSADHVPVSHTTKKGSPWFYFDFHFREPRRKAGQLSRMYRLPTIWPNASFRFSNNIHKILVAYALGDARRPLFQSTLSLSIPRPRTP